MNIQAKPVCRWAVAALVSAVSVATAGAVAAPAGAVVGAARPGRAAPHAVSWAAQRATRAYWTPARMAAATPLRGGPRAGGLRAGRPSGIPSPTRFAGVPTAGALFLTTGTKPHFCTASVVKSKPEDLILTAAHCVYSSSYASNIEFVPKYRGGQQPYGAWPVKKIFVAAGWRHSHNPNRDFAFLSVAPPGRVTHPIQKVTGGLRLGINRGYRHHIEVIGYNNTGNAPIRCATASFRFAANQMKFFCHDYQDGTSGGPWIIGYHGQDGTGTVFGVIGGYQQGGDHPWASYSAYFAEPTRKLFRQAEGQGQAAG